MRVYELVVKFGQLSELYFVRGLSAAATQVAKVANTIFLAYALFQVQHVYCHSPYHVCDSA